MFSAVYRHNTMSLKMICQKHSWNTPGCTNMFRRATDIQMKTRNSTKILVIRHISLGQLRFWWIFGFSSKFKYPSLVGTCQCTPECSNYVFRRLQTQYNEFKKDLSKTQLEHSGMHEHVPTSDRHLDENPKIHQNLSYPTHFPGIPVSSNKYLLIYTSTISIIFEIVKNYIYTSTRISAPSAPL